MPNAFSPGEGDSFIASGGWTEAKLAPAPKKRWFRRAKKNLGLSQVHAYLQAEGRLPDTTRSKGTGTELITIDGKPTKVKKGPQISA